MKKITLRTVAAIMVIVMMAAVIAGCKKEEPESSFEPPEFVYVAESVKLPGDIGDVWNFAYTDGKLFFASSYYDFDEETSNYTYGSKMYSVNIDGTGLKQLENYSTPIDVPDDASGGASINALNVDAGGNLWIVENYEFFIYNLPDDFDPDIDYMWNYQEYLGSGNSIRKLDATGTELLSIDLSGIASQYEYFNVQAFNIDGAGNIYIVVYDWQNDARVIYVLDNNGNRLFDLKTESWFNSFIRLSDGTIAFTEEQYNEMGYSRALRSIDVAAKALGTAYDLPQRAWNVFPGGGEYDILFDENDTIYGFTLGQEEPVRLLNWMESDIANNGIDNITLLSDGRLMCTMREWDNRTNESGTEIFILTKTPYSELPEKTIITLAVHYIQQDIRDAVVKFNRNSPDYRIHVIDYSDFNTEDDYTAGITRLSAEIIAGNAPDMINISWNIPYREFAEKGLFADLYPFIESDPEISMDQLMQKPIRAAEIGGELYQVFSSFTVSTILGSPEIVGPGTGWTMDEFNAVLEAHPDADMPLGQWLTKLSFLQSAVSFNIDKFIDWDAGKVYFDSPEFVSLLEYTSSLPEEIDYDSVSNWDDFWIPEDESIPSGRQIMAQASIDDVSWFVYYKILFGGEVAFKGFPCDDRNGNTFSVYNGIAITEASKHKEAAWQFARTLLTEDFQLRNYWMWGFPTNQNAFDDTIRRAKEDEGSHGINNIIIDSISQDDVDDLLTLINSAEGLSSWNLDMDMWNIISEDATNFYSGTITAQQAADFIQSRLEMYVSERS